MNLENLIGQNKAYGKTENQGVGSRFLPLIEGAVKLPVKARVPEGVKNPGQVAIHNDGEGFEEEMIIEQVLKGDLKLVG